jgi:endoribonuclease LACTB2
MGELRRAACIVLYRGGPAEPEILLTRRAATLSFLGGFDALPGGSVDPVDERASLPGDTHEDATFRSAALRELFEETGVLLARGAAALGAHERTRLRRRLVDDHGRSWADMITQHKLEPDANALLPMGRWVTPPYTPVRFDAQYYAAELPDGQTADIWPGELTHGVWVTATEALARHQRGELFITYPVLETLRRIAQARGDLLEASRLMGARGYVTYPHAGGEVIAGVYMAPGRTPTLPPATHTNTYILGGEDLVLVDPATPYEDDQRGLLAFIDHLQGSVGKLREVWLTHHHHDHVGAVQLVRERYGVPVAAHPLTAEALGDDLKVDRLIDEGTSTTLRITPGMDATWTALHTPGHTRGHLCFYEQRLGSLLSGDLVLGYGTVLVAPPDGNMRQYMASLARLLPMRLGFVFPAHGPPIAAAHHKIREYIAHRTMREDAIVGALRTGPLTAAEIVPRVYSDINQAAWSLAELNVRAHLEKLEEERRVAQNNERYALTT